eukprot:gnl/TRDRNA2_/TRDRNA2_197826_c0_seq1.p1 gnl/TRDRNA2_/TRDRNA2_197826_c0~~gnl/TRDRNA2_/TRDRNA2_197826_c0_seq1.p1  ORF type:complete len:422 (-),score=21.21 gnl/TRDRNA2_/TRDRNA2_197826_c0_seq1:51-1316(-)
MGYITRNILFSSLFHVTACLRVLASNDRDLNATRVTKGLSADTPTLCFHANSAGARGVQVAMYDYADQAEKQWRATSKIMFPSSAFGPSNDKESSLERFVSRFGESNVFAHHLDSDIRQTANRHGCNFLYIIKDGSRTGKPSESSLQLNVHNLHDGLKVGIHNVFQKGDGRSHGDAYCGISEALHTKCVVPHMVIPPDVNARSYGNLRAELNITQDALVLCRHGGPDQFDLPDAQQAVIRTARQYNKKLHFVMLNTYVFDAKGPPNIHYVPAMVSIPEKERFFNTCDGMIHGRRMGETFGLAVAEFSVRNKPVITNVGAVNMHLQILKDVAYVYHNVQEAARIIEHFVENGIPKGKNYNAYASYSPVPVMHKFRTGFLEPLGIHVVDRGKAEGSKSQIRFGAAWPSSSNDTWIERNLFADV